MGRKVLAAGALAYDLADNLQSWSYLDPRLAAAARVTNPNDATCIQPLFAIGHEATLAQPLQYGENAGSLVPGQSGADPNAVHTSALGAWTGASPDVDGDGRPDFARYWSVFDLDQNGDGVAEAKIVVITVRWWEASLGALRTINLTVVRNNPAVFGLTP
jgi:hypothetical protein